MALNVENILKNEIMNEKERFLLSWSIFVRIHFDHYFNINFHISNINIHLKKAKHKFYAYIFQFFIRMKLS
jgi:hypothetical protein